MRKLFAAVLAVGMIAVAASTSFAAFTSKSTTVVIASATFIAEGQVNVSAVIKNIVDDADATQLGFSGTGGNPPTGWKVSDQYILLHSTITHSSGALQIYTNNYNNAVASERYSGVVNSSYSASPAGLVDMSTTTKVLPMCWRITTVDTATATSDLTIVQGPVGPAPDYQVHLYAAQLGGVASDYPCFLWMLDKGMWGFGNGKDYAIIRDMTHGIQHGEATWAMTNVSPLYVYLGADFSFATTPNTYKTTSLTIEAYHD